MLTPCRDCFFVLLISIYIYSWLSLRIYLVPSYIPNKNFCLAFKRTLNKHTVYRRLVVHRTTLLYYTHTTHHHNQYVDPHQTALPRAPHTCPSLSLEQTYSVAHTARRKSSSQTTRNDLRLQLAHTNVLELALHDISLSESTHKFACIITANKSQSQRQPHGRRQAHRLGSGRGREGHEVSKTSVRVRRIRRRREDLESLSLVRVSSRSEQR